MPRLIVINSTPQEARVATMENARLLEIQVERVRERSLAGSICKGRVLRVLPGMQAAFVDVGLEKAAFLPGADFFPLSADEYALRETPGEAEDPPAAEPAGEATGAGGRRARVLPPIEERLQKGQDVIVQISKEPIGSKGARLTSNISLPGRYLVYLPYSNQIGISRRLASEEERQRLREAVEAVASESGGIIIRTACEGVSKREIQADLRLLRRQWQHLSRKAESLPAPAILHQELDVILRTMRDLSASDATRVVVDNRRDYQRIVDFTDEVMPRARPRVDLYELPEPIFERYGVEAQINKALERKVWLKSGGYIVIDHTEALTAIDVNTGRFIGKTDQRETALRTNLEAARVIADQLRLRNIGGLIIIDFIDMEHAEDRKAVLAALNDSIKGDKARATILGLSELGLVEMTRQRTRESLAQRLCEPCPACGQRGLVKGVATTAYEILRRIRREATVNGAVQRLEVGLPAAVLTFLNQYEPAALREVERELGVPVIVTALAAADPGEYSIVPVVAKEAAK